MELLPAPDEFCPTTDPAPKRFGYLREFNICYVFIALE